MNAMITSRIATPSKIPPKNISLHQSESRSRFEEKRLSLFFLSVIYDARKTLYTKHNYTRHAQQKSEHASDCCAVASKSRITMLSTAMVFSNMIVRWQPLSICEIYDDVTAYKFSRHQLASRLSYIQRTKL